MTTTFSFYKQVQRSTKDRYPKFKKDGSIKYHKHNELFYLSEKILEWFYRDELGIVIVHGQQGYGKSCYASICCAEVYGHDADKNRFYYNWDAVKTHMLWTPEDFIALSQKKNMGTNPLYSNKEPLVIWDDAGYYLNSMDYRDPLCIYVSKFLEVARSRWGCVMFTVSDQSQLLNKIRGIPHAWSIPIIKPDSTAGLHNIQYMYRGDLRFAQLYRTWCSEDMKRSGKSSDKGDLFYARMPLDFYNWYKPLRDSYCDQAIEDMNKAEKTPANVYRRYQRYRHETR